MQQIAAITLGVRDLDRSTRFYTQGFGWTPVFRNSEIIFYQMNGAVLATWTEEALAMDMGRVPGEPSGSSSLSHNVSSSDAVEELMERLTRAGGSLLRKPDAPPHGGYRGYVADPDGHAWEIAWNPAWPIDEQGHVTFAL